MKNVDRSKLAVFVFQRIGSFNDCLSMIAVDEMEAWILLTQGLGYVPIRWNIICTGPL